MKISETIERECCAHKDLIEYKGKRNQSNEYPPKLHFCKYCGQLWYATREMDASGGSETVVERILI